MSDNTQELTATQVFQAYVGVLHVVMVAMILVIFGLGAGLVYTAHLNQKTIDKLSTTLQERDELILQNMQQKEMLKPIEEKIRKGANYIHKRFNKPMDVALEISRREMTESLRTGMLFSVGLALTGKESSFNTRAVSYTGCCYGLKQIHLKVWRQERPGLVLADLYDPDRNIQLGYDILREYYNHTGSLPAALGRYYGSTVPEENVAYAEDVLRRSRDVQRYLNS